MKEPPANAASQEDEESPGAASVGGSRFDPSPSSPQFAIGTVNEKVTSQSVHLRRPSSRISRRHSTQSGVVHPIADDPSESLAQTASKLKTPLRRSVSTRLLRGLSTTRVPRLYFANSLNPIGSNATAEASARNVGEDTASHPAESPYEEMMVRFQIRHLQRTASVHSEDRRGIHDGGSDPSVVTSAHDRELGRPSPRRMSDRMSSLPDNGGRSGSYQRLASLNTSDHPPLQSGTSSAQLAEQFNLAFEHEARAGRRDPSWLVSALVALQTWQSRLCRPLSPYSTIAQVRYAVMLVATTTYVLWFPIELAFPDIQELTNVDAAIGVVFGLDTLLTLHTGYVTPTGALVLSHRLILWHYVKTRLLLDVFLAVPLIVHTNRSNTEDFGGKWMTFVLDVLSIERLVHITRFVRMIWLIRANQSGGGNNFWAWLLYSRYSHLIRIAGIVTMLICIAHYIACVWTVLLEASDGDALPWPAQYSESFYAALLLLQGEGVPTSTAGQNLFASLSVLVGSVVLAVVFGHVAILVANFNANFTSYQRKMEAVIAMTAKLQLPVSLRERIHEYYEHLWHEYECIDGEIVQFSKELSHTLGLEVVLFKYMELVMHVPFWKDCTPDFQKQLMLRLDVRVYLPNDFIMREGEVDDEFYMINRGHCELSRSLDRFERVTTTMMSGRSGSGMNTSRGTGGLTARRRTVVAQAGQLDDGHRQSAYELDEAQRRYYSSNGGVGKKGCEIVVSRGQAFGDLALLMNYQRAANVRAITHVEMCVLSRADFQAVLTRYPEDRRRVVVDMLTSYMQSYEVSQSRCPILELVRSVYSAEAIAEACAKAGAAPPLLPSILTARQAAEKIYLAINVDLQDTTLKFGVGVNIREQLVELRERRRQKRKQQTQKTGATGASTSQTRHDSGAPTRSESQPATEAAIAETALQVPLDVHGPAQPQADQPTLQQRLALMEEREMVILRALQELQASLEVLRARLAAAESPPVFSSRKRATPGSDAPVAKASGPVRPPLLQRMGSLVGLSSGAAVDSKPTLQDEAKQSPTRYADELFSSQAPSPPRQQTEAHVYHQERHQRARPHLQPIRKATEPSFQLSPEVEKLIAATEASFLTGSRSSGTSTSSASDRNGLGLLGRQPAPQQPVEAGAFQRLRNFQRQHSRSLRTLEAAYQASTNPSTATTPTAEASQGLERRSMFQRKASQSLRALADAAAAQPAKRAPRGSVGSIPTASTASTSPTRILQRMSTFVADTSGQANRKPSPTRYADALFRRRSNEPSKVKKDDS